MTFIARTAFAGDPGSAEATHPELWRQARRFNVPVKLALTAAHDVAARATAPAEARLGSLAPCQAGSPELWRATHAFETNLAQTGKAARVRVNPTYTLHAIDNLALSALAIDLKNHAPCLGLGGAAGQAWCALEWILEQPPEPDGEVLLLAGDQAPDGASALGVAVLLRGGPGDGQAIRLVAVERAPLVSQAAVGPLLRPHSAAGLQRWLDALSSFAAQERGPFAYAVPPADSDGRDRITVVAEVR
jgi:hypothetical protein